LKVSILLALLLFVFTSIQKGEIKLEIGSVLSAKLVPKKNRKLYMTHSAQLRPYIERTVAGISYIIAYDEKTREITYISTKDKNFKTVENLQVGSFVELNRKEISAYPGWEVRGLETKDGWETLLGFDNKVTVLRDGAEVQIDPEVDTALQAGQTAKVKVTGFVKGSN
jgi:hypothetical protein